MSSTRSRSRLLQPSWPTFIWLPLTLLTLVILLNRNLLQQLSSYQLLLSSLSKTEHKLAKASLELLSYTSKEGNATGAGEVVCEF